MKPFLFNLFSTPIPSFFFFIMVATLAATFYGVWLGKKNGLKPEYILDLGIVGMLSAVIGARIFHIVVEAPDYYWEKPFRVLEFWRGGFVSIGGFLGILTAMPLYLRFRKVPVWSYLDLVACTAPLIFFFVRLACLLTGCCYGPPTDLPWAITFTDPDSTAYHYHPNTPLHPTQVYGMMKSILLFFLVNLTYRKRRFAGQTSLVLLMSYALTRPILELFRADLDRGVYFGGAVSTAQISSLVIFTVSAVLYWKLSRQRKETTSG